MINIKSILSILILTLIFGACVSHQELITFEKAAFDEDSLQAIDNKIAVTIQPQDLLNISVSSFEEEVVRAFNTQGGQIGNVSMNQTRTQGGGSANAFEYFSGYLVDDEGFIDFPVLGKVNLSGLTRREAKELLQQKIEPFAKDVTVNVRFLNFKITVLGDVETPGPQLITNERYTILEAIGAAGDFTNYANRARVLVIREKEEQRSYAWLDLQDKKIFQSPFFYLQQNDVIYVEPTKNKTAAVADPLLRYITIGSGILSLIAVIITLAK